MWLSAERKMKNSPQESHCFFMVLISSNELERVNIGRRFIAYPGTLCFIKHLMGVRIISAMCY